MYRSGLGCWHGGPKAIVQAPRPRCQSWAHLKTSTLKTKKKAHAHLGVLQKKIFFPSLAHIKPVYNQYFNVSSVCLCV